MRLRRPRARRAVRPQRIAGDLRPGALDRLGLDAALRHEARRFQARTGITCDVAVAPGVPEVTGEPAIALYRIGQEALTNVARHAGAARVALRLSAEGSALRLAARALSGRELQVLRVVASGRTLKEIAAELHLSEKNIATYRARISEKLGVSTNVELTRYAMKHQLVE